MIPFIPSELVTIIFEYLYDSLCYSAGRGLYDTPNAAGFVFSRLSLVSKSWHSLALPFLVRNFTQPGGFDHITEGYLVTIQRYDLAKCVRTVALNFADYTESSFPLTRKLLEELCTAGKPRVLDLSVDHSESASRRDFFSLCPFLQRSTSLALAGFETVVPPALIPQLPQYLTHLRYWLEPSERVKESLPNSLPLILARRCAPTLRTLSLCGLRASWGFTATEFFHNVVFTKLKTLYIDCAWCEESDLSTHFPDLQSAALVLSLHSFSTTPTQLPKPLENLTFLGVNKRSLRRIMSGFEDLVQGVDSLQHFQISTRGGENTGDPFGNFKQLGEVPEIAQIHRTCQSRGIRFRCTRFDPMFNWPIQQRARVSTTEEEEDLDFDAEDGEEFRHLWSREKLAELEDGKSELLSLVPEYP
jgi:hypothetical protein